MIVHRPVDRRLFDRRRGPTVPVCAIAAMGYPTSLVSAPCMSLRSANLWYSNANTKQKANRTTAIADA
jgi:hypothetical protein